MSSRIALKEGDGVLTSSSGSESGDMLPGRRSVTYPASCLGRGAPSVSELSAISSHINGRKASGPRSTFLGSSGRPSYLYSPATPPLLQKNNKAYPKNSFLFTIVFHNFLLRPPGKAIGRNAYCYNPYPLSLPGFTPAGLNIGRNLRRMAQIADQKHELIIAWRFSKKLPDTRTR